MFSPRDAGAVVVNYPFDNSNTGKYAGYYSASPDDDVFVELAKTYSFAHTTMRSAVCEGNMHLR